MRERDFVYWLDGVMQMLESTENTAEIDIFSLLQRINTRLKEVKETIKQGDLLWPQREMISENEKYETDPGML